MYRLVTFSVFILSISSSCKKDMKIRDYVDHWEITRTYLTYNNSSLVIDTINNDFKVIDGHNQIIIVTIERNPIFKEGKELTDLFTTKSLLIELDSSDNFVTVQKTSNSKLYRKILAFSPEHGINPLHKEEQLTLIRKFGSTWAINSQINDFEFKAEFNFLTNQVLSDKIKEY